MDLSYGPLNIFKMMPQGVQAMSKCHDKVLRLHVRTRRYDTVAVHRTCQVEEELLNTDIKPHRMPESFETLGETREIPW